VRAFCRETQESFPAIDINIDLDISDTDIPEKLKIVIYRVIQEGLTNAAKHANADTIEICIEKENNGIGLLIRDNGKGFDPATIQGNHMKGKGIGLKNIQDRAEIYGGEFFLNSMVDHGTTLEFSWPLTD
jgi:signal transduction histidine kinase